MPEDADHVTATPVPLLVPHARAANASGAGSEPAIQAAYKAQIAHRFGMSVEGLSNDRYDGFNQVCRAIAVG